ncbi:MAG: hypothetical protein AB8B69_26155 [Chitinophagales bacterium]
MNPASLSFNAFQKDFTADIAPFYEAHENSFDFAGIHGRKHISRAIVFGECIARYYAKHFHLQVDFEAARTAIAFHDAGREGNGKDWWETESAALCLAYLQQKNKDEIYCSQVANFISQKEEAHSWGQIVYDADVLEIMRLFCNTPDGLQKFRTGELYFLSHKDVLIPPTSKAEKTARNQIIEEAWALIRATEEAGTIRVSNDYLQDLVKWIGENEAKFPFIWECLFKA